MFTKLICLLISITLSNIDDITSIGEEIFEYQSVSDTLYINGLCGLLDYPFGEYYDFEQLKKAVPHDTDPKRNTDKDGGKQINQNEGGASVLSDHVGESPDIAQTYSRASHRQNGGGFVSKGFSCHLLTSFLIHYKLKFKSCLFVPVGFRFGNHFPNPGIYFREEHIRLFHHRVHVGHIE